MSDFRNNVHRITGSINVFVECCECHDPKRHIVGIPIQMDLEEGMVDFLPEELEEQINAELEKQGWETRTFGRCVCPKHAQLPTPPDRYQESRDADLLED